MKTINLFLLGIAMLVSTSASAQFVSASGSKAKSVSSSASMDKSNYFLLDLKVGGVGGVGGFGVNLGGEKRYNEYIAWDYINFEYSAPFNSPADMDILSLKTGIRAFSPSFCNDKLRFYANLSVGYTCVLSKLPSYDYDDINDYDYDDYDFDDFDYDYWMDYYDYYYGSSSRATSYNLGNIVSSSSDLDISASHGFGLTFGIGFQYNKKISVGYSLQYETAFKSKCHFATIGFAF